MTPRFRPAHVGVDLGAIRANVAELRRRAAPAAVLAVALAGTSTGCGSDRDSLPGLLEAMA